MPSPLRLAKRLRGPRGQLPLSSPRSVIPCGSGSLHALVPKIVARSGIVTLSRHFSLARDLTSYRKLPYLNHSPSIRCRRTKIACHFESHTQKDEGMMPSPNSIQDEYGWSPNRALSAHQLFLRFWHTAVNYWRSGGPRCAWPLTI